ncbi:MAG TPA: hypothetical protein VMX18_00355 [Candidatus Bipolaricaulota bacterium]|nr:hypothetical protein [Candidatus Bipolaricaulota bacterium]
MDTLKQKSIEQYFADYKVTDPDQKAKLLPDLTRIIYDRNIYVVQAEKTDDGYKKTQIIKDATDLDKKIDEIIKEIKA